MRCEVLRPFQATNEALMETGQIVDTTGWREESVLRLINQRYLRQTFEPQSVPDAVQGPTPEREPESEEELETTGEPVPIPETDPSSVNVVSANPAMVMDALGRFPRAHRGTKH